jgi:hypothetical protein
MCTTEPNERRRAIATVLLDHILANRELADENLKMREILDRLTRCDLSTVPRATNSALLDALSDAYKLNAMFPLDTCPTCGGPRGANGQFRHEDTCPGDYLPGAK